MFVGMSLLGALPYQSAAMFVQNDQAEGRRAALRRRGGYRTEGNLSRPSIIKA
jgi:hypothetical protein